MHPSSWPRYRNVTAAARKRRLSALSRPRLPLPPPRLLAVAIAFAFALLFLVLVLLSATTSPPSPQSHHAVVVARSSSSSSAPPSLSSPRCSSAAASLGELGDAMVSMLPRDLPFTVFVPSADSFSRVLRLQGSSPKSNASAAAAGEEAAAAAAEAGSDTDSNTYAILSRMLGFSAVPRRLLAADVPAVPVRLLDSVSGLRLYASRDARGALVVNGVRSECVDLVRGETVVHVMAGVLMDAEFERSFSAELI